MFFFLNVDPRNVDVFSANLNHIERVFFFYRVNNTGPPANEFVERVIG